MPEAEVRIHKGCFHPLYWGRIPEESRARRAGRRYLVKRFLQNFIRVARACALMLSCLAVTACSSLAGIYQVNVDSMARQGLNFNAVPLYEFRPAPQIMQGVRADDLFFCNVADKVSSCLASRGMREARRGEKADVVIYLSYGVGDARQETAVESIPSYRPRIGLRYWNDPFFFDDVYYRQRVYNYTSYLRWLEVSARRLVKGEAEDQLWVTRAESRGSSADLYNVLPWLLEAMRADFAANTYGTAAYEVRVDRSGPAEIRRKR